MKKAAPPHRALQLYSNAVPGLWALLFAAVFCFDALQYRLFFHSWSTALERFVLPAVLAGLCGLVTLLSLETRIAIANMLVAVIVSLYAGELFLAHRQEVFERRAAQVSGVPFDRRDKLHVIRDLRRKGVDAYPVMRAENMLLEDQHGALRPVLWAGGKPLLSFGSIPGTTVVSCNETGQWQIYEADRHGFNNPDSQWDARPVIGMVGDSFTHGSCVPSDRNMAALLRQRFGDVLNLGVGGFGPMLELAALTEYLRPLRPPLVLWVFFEGNDLTEDLPREMQSPLLHRYLEDDGFSQDLIHRSGELKTAMRSYLDGQLREAMNRVDNPHEDLARYLSLDRVRELVGVGHVQIGFNAGRLDPELAQFDEILRKADRRVVGWGGQLYLVYFPESDRYLSRVGTSVLRQAIYRGVRGITARAHIPMIDLAAAFAEDPSPDTLYAYPGAHCSARGYRLAAETIATTLASKAHLPGAPQS